MMFVLADNEKIGQYLADCIDERFESRRQFCKKYLEAKGEQMDNGHMRNMSNRLSQILKGKKEIQLYDLPLFCRLLETSCEDILSAGKNHAPASMRLTNYVAAFSKDEREWEAYVNQEDSPILNADEYGKTFIDYALEAENYDLLKYLMDKQFIWFVGTDKNDYFVNFGAGTSIEKANFPNTRNLNVLEYELKVRDELRMHMIVLAIQHEDMGMLEQLHAREIPTFYQLSFHSAQLGDYEKYYNIKFMEALTRASDKVLEYFCEEFEISDRFGSPNRFFFPFMGELIERLLLYRTHSVEYMLRDTIRHNQYVYDQLKAFLTDAVQYYKNVNCDITNGTTKKYLTQKILGDLRFYGNGRLVNYFTLLSGTRKRWESNIIWVNAESEDTMINRRISELNDLYRAIHDITPDFGESASEC